MATVLLISANIATEPYPVFPLGMAVVAGALHGHGHEVHQFDHLMAGPETGALEETVARVAPDFVGISIRNIDNVDSFSVADHWWVENARAIVARVRAARPGAVIFLGGAGLSLLPGPIREYTGADHALPGEGEENVPRFLAAMAAGEALPPVYRHAAPVPADRIPPPRVDPAIARFYVDRTGLMNCQTKRGCPHRCAYCTYPALEGAAFRPRPVEAVIEELARAKRDHNPTEIFFTDSVFNDAKGQYLTLCEAMIRADLNLRWGAFFRPQGMGDAELALMKRAGLFAMELGTDAASDATLAGLVKDFTWADVADVAAAAVRHELPTAHFIIFGGPGETKETVEEGLANLEALDKTVVFAFCGIRVLPGAPLHKRAVAEGVVAAEDPLLHPRFYYAPALDVPAMQARIEESFRGRRDRIFPPDEGQKRMAVMERFGYKGLLWNQLINFAPRRARRAVKGE